MRFWKLPLAAILVSVVGACGATREQLVRRAAFDLNCGEGDIEVVDLDDRTRGVRGCGRQATYVESCEVIQGSRGNCTWVLNADASKIPEGGGGTSVETPSIDTATPR